MPKVTRRDGESGQQLVRRFKRSVSKSGVLGQVRKRRWFISKTEQRRIAKKKAIRRMKRKRRGRRKKR